MPQAGITQDYVAGDRGDRTEGMRELMRHYATEGLFIVPTFPVALAVFWLAKLFAWSDRTISAALIVWIIAWGGVVLLRGDRIIDRVVGLVSGRNNVG